MTRTIRTGDEYIESLRNRDLDVHFMGERVAEPVDHALFGENTVGLHQFSLGVGHRGLQSRGNPH